MLEVRTGGKVRLHRLPAMQRDIAPGADARALVELIGVIRRFRPDVVHTHTSKAGALGRVAAAACRVPVIIHTYHGNVFSGYFGSVGSRLAISAERQLAKLSSGVVAISARQRDELIARGVAEPERIHLIPLGFDLDAFASARRGSLRGVLGIPNDVRLIGTVARLVPIKGVDIFLRAAALVAQREPDVAFIVIGDGPLKNELKQLAHELGITPMVWWMGWRSDLPSLYPDFDAIVLTSHNEGTPVAVIEALAAAVPVVATAVGGVPDVLGDSAFGELVPDKDVDMLAERVLRVLRDPPAARRKAALGQAHVLGCHGAAALVGAVADLYLRLLAGRRVKSRDASSVL